MKSNIEKNTINNYDLSSVSEEDFKEVLNQYDIKGNEAVTLMNLIIDNENKVEKDYYNELPASIKDIANGMKMAAIHNGQKLSNNDAAKFILNEFSHDAAMNSTMDQFKSELNSTIGEINKGFSDTYTEAIKETFDKIDELESTDPEEANRIKAIKYAFENCLNFEKEEDFINKKSYSKLKKMISDKKYEASVFYFNKIINKTKVKFPDINKIVAVLNKHFKDKYSIEVYKIFIISIIESENDLDIENKSEDLAYIYKMISFLYSYTFVDTNGDYDYESYNKAFNRIAKLLDIIESKKELN